MVHASSSLATEANAIRIWKHGESAIPEWVRPHMSGGLENNNTFALETNLGRARVHPGHVVIECLGDLWVRQPDEAAQFIDDLKANKDSTITNVGPGKVRQFGIGRRSERGERKAGSAGKARTFHYAQAVGSPPSIEWVKLERLSVDIAYQRSTDNEASRRLITSIAMKFDWRLCSPLVVARRDDDSFVIIDGQHRWMAAKRRTDILHLPCCVFRYENMAEEARMFILANRARKPINRLDDYFAALAAEDEDALEMQQVVTDAGLTIARNTSSTAWQPGEVAFTSSIMAAIRRQGSAITSAALTNMAEAFPAQKLKHGGAIFGGLLRLMTKTKPDFDPDRLMSVLQRRTAEEWGALATGLKGGEVRIRALHDAILDAYSTQPYNLKALRLQDTTSIAAPYASPSIASDPTCP